MMVVSNSLVMAKSPFDTYAASLSRLEEELSGQGFTRTHRKYLVNPAFIEEWDTAANTIQVHGVELPFSRRKQKQLTNGKD